MDIVENQDNNAATDAAAFQRRGSVCGVKKWCDVNGQCGAGH